jgi:hypothetical protein
MLFSGVQTVFTDTAPSCSGVQTVITGTALSFNYVLTLVSDIAPSFSGVLPPLYRYNTYIQWRAHRRYRYSTFSK